MIAMHNNHSLINAFALKSPSWRIVFLENEYLLAGAVMVKIKSILGLNLTRESSLTLKKGPNSSCALLS